MRLFHRGPDLRGAEVAGHLDEVGSRRELLAHRLPPVVGPPGLAHLAVAQGSVRGARPLAAFGAVTARAHEQPARREHPGPGQPALRHPLLELERDVAGRAHVAHARDAALDVEAELLHRAQGARGVGGLGALRVGVVEVGVEVDEAGQHGAARHVDDPGGRRRLACVPAGSSARDAVPLDHERAFARGGAGAVEDAAAPQHDCALRPPRARGHGNAARVVAGGGRGVEEAPAVRGAVLADGARGGEGAQGQESEGAQHRKGSFRSRGAAPTHGEGRSRATRLYADYNPDSSRRSPSCSGRSPNHGEQRERARPGPELALHGRNGGSRPCPRPSWPWSP